MPVKKRLTPMKSSFTLIVIVELAYAPSVYSTQKVTMMK